MNGILSLIYMLSLNSLDRNVTYNIANYIIAHIHDVESMNIREISKKTFTSTTSMMKFCQLLGFDSYNDFKFMFSYTLKDCIRQLHRKIQDESLEDLFDEINHLSKEELNRNDFLNSIESFVDILYQKKELYIHGAVFPINLCMSFAEDMTIMGIPVHFVQGGYSVNKLPKNEGVHLIISYTGRFITQRKLDYIKIVDCTEFSALFSRKTEDVKGIDFVFPFPKSKSVDFDDVILLYILDIIKLIFYKKYYKK